MNSRRRLIIFGALVLCLIAVAALANVLAPYDPNAAVLTDANQPPCAAHIFGTDRMGRDLFSRVLFGARTSLSSTLLLVVCIFLTGGLLGTLAGYLGGWADSVIMRVSDMMVSFPGMALAIAMAGIMGAGITNAVIAITMVSWTKYARLARSLVLKVKHQDYVLAARVSGSTMGHILLRYMLPTVLPTLVITAASDIGGMMLELAGFSFLGLGAQATSIEWGYMLNEGRDYMEAAPWLMVFPGLAIFTTVVVFNLFGDSLRDVLDPLDEHKSPLSKKKRRNENMKLWKKTIAAALCAAMLCTALSACGGTSAGSDSAAAESQTADAASSQSAGAESGGKHLNFGCYNYSDSLDPATNVNASWAGVRYGITECLFKFSKDVVAQPNICDTYEVSDDHLTWTLHIRDGVKFSDGNDVTASSVAASIERLYAQTDTANGGTGNSKPQGYLVYDSLTADDGKGTVTIVCSAPTNNLPGILCYPYFAIIEADKADSEIIGTGPYKVDSVNSSVSLELSRNEYYWNGQVPYDTVTMVFIEDSATKAMALQSGDVDIAENITTASDLEKLKNDDAYYVSIATGVRTANTYMNFNGALSNADLRKAILMALDDETMCNITVSGMYTPGYSVLPSSLAYNYDKLTDPYKFDKQTAIDLLDGAGIVDSDGDGWRELDGKNIDLNYIAFSSRNLSDFAQAVALQLSDIGIKVTANVRDYDTAMALQNAGEFDLITANTLTVGVGDPQDYLGNWYSGNSASFGSYKNADYDKLYEQLQSELDDTKRLDLITQLQQILIDDAATIVHGYYNSTMASAKASVSGADIATIDYYWLTTDVKPAA